MALPKAKSRWKQALPLVPATAALAGMNQLGWHMPESFAVQAQGMNTESTAPDSDCVELGITQWLMPNIPEVNRTPDFAPLRHQTWSNKLEHRFEDLAFKKALGPLSRDDKAEFENLLALRRRHLPSRSADEIMHCAEQDQLIREMNEVLQKYIAFSSRRPYYESHASSTHA